MKSLPRIRIGTSITTAGVEITSLHGPDIYSGIRGFYVSHRNNITRLSFKPDKGSVLKVLQVSKNPLTILNYKDRLGFILSNTKGNVIECKVYPREKERELGIRVSTVNQIATNTVKVIGIQALNFDELPSLYTNCKDSDYSMPAVWKQNDGLLRSDGTILLHKGSFYSPGPFRKAMVYIELAGRHLALANKFLTERRLPFQKRSLCELFVDGVLQDEKPTMSIDLNLDKLFPNRRQDEKTNSK